MKYFQKMYSKKEFDDEMEIVKNILEEKGFILESDHPFAYSMQYNTAFNDVVEWLAEHSYNSDMESLGLFDGVAVYGLYDTKKVSYEDMMSNLRMEARRQG